MKVRTVKYKTVSAASADGLDTALGTARSEITQQRQEAEFVDLKFAASQGTLYATIVWSD